MKLIKEYILNWGEALEISLTFLIVIVTVLVYALIGREAEKMFDDTLKLINGGEE